MKPTFLLSAVLLAGCTFAISQTNGPTGVSGGRDNTASDTGNGAQTSKLTPTSTNDVKPAVGTDAIKAATPALPLVLPVEKKPEAPKVEEPKPPVPPVAPVEPPH